MRFDDRVTGTLKTMRRERRKFTLKLIRLKSTKM